VIPRWLLPALPAAPLQGLKLGHYGVVYADPAWAFLTWGGELVTPHRTAEDHYRTSHLDELAALPVGDIAAPDCALFMWAIGSHLDQAIDLGRAWGFTFITDVFYWAKQRLRGADQIDIFTDDIPEPKIGMGHWSRKQVEPCLLFTRGSPRRLSKGVRQLIIEPPREHSAKPDQTRTRIEQLVAGPYVELFARRSAEGWDCWGDEAGKFDRPRKAGVVPAPTAVISPSDFALETIT
jgi:N6-adenosine-specific RNA methylase IME4